MPLKRRTKRYVSGHPSLAKDEPCARQSWQKLRLSFNSRPRSLALARKSSQQLAALMADQHYSYRTNSATVQWEIGRAERIFTPTVQSLSSG